MTRVAVEASAFALPLDGIDPRHVAAAMGTGIDLLKDGGFAWSAHGMTALLWLRERAAVIITDVPAELTDTLLAWGLGVTDQPLVSMSEVAVIIDCPPLMLTEAAALSALDAAR